MNWYQYPPGSSFTDDPEEQMPSGSKLSLDEVKDVLKISQDAFQKKYHTTTRLPSDRVIAYHMERAHFIRENIERVYEKPFCRMTLEEKKRIIPSDIFTNQEGKTFNEERFPDFTANKPSFGERFWEICRTIFGKNSLEIFSEVTKGQLQDAIYAEVLQKVAQEYSCSKDDAQVLLAQVFFGNQAEKEQEILNSYPETSQDWFQDRCGQAFMSSLAMHQGR